MARMVSALKAAAAKGSGEQLAEYQALTSNKDKRMYYYNDKTFESTFERPAEWEQLDKDVFCDECQVWVDNTSGMARLHFCQRAWTHRVLALCTRTLLPGYRNENRCATSMQSGTLWKRWWPSARNV